MFRRASDALESVERAGFYNVQLYIHAGAVAMNDLNHARIQRLLNERITRIVVFTRDGPVDFKLPER